MLRHATRAQGFPNNAVTPVTQAPPSGDVGRGWQHAWTVRSSLMDHHTSTVEVREHAASLPLCLHLYLSPSRRPSVSLCLALCLLSLPLLLTLDLSLPLSLALHLRGVCGISHRRSFWFQQRNVQMFRLKTLGNTRIPNWELRVQNGLEWWWNFDLSS